MIREYRWATAVVAQVPRHALRVVNLPSKRGTVAWALGATSTESSNNCFCF